MKLDYSFVEELTALGSEVKPIKLINSRLAVFNHSLASELNLPSEWQHERDLFNAMFAEQGVLNYRSVAQKYGGHQIEQWNPELGGGRGLFLAEDIDEQQKFSVLPL